MTEGIPKEILYDEVQEDSRDLFEVEDDFDYEGGGGGEYRCHTAKDAADAYMEEQVSLSADDSCIVTCTNTRSGEVERFEYSCETTCYCLDE